jgi:S-formylglutathione hydrolase FrmB
MLSPGVPPLLLYVAAGSTPDSTVVWGDPYTSERANWTKHDPLTLIKNLKGMGVYISCGDGTEGPADNGAQDIRYVSEQLINMDDHYFTDKATELGIPMTVHYYSPGSHSWHYWVREMHTSFPLMMKAIGAAKV